MTIHEKLQSVNSRMCEISTELYFNENPTEAAILRTEYDYLKAEHTNLVMTIRKGA